MNDTIYTLSQVKRKAQSVFLSLLMLFTFFLILTLSTNKQAYSQMQVSTKDNAKEQAMRLLASGISLHEAGDYVQAETMLLSALDAVRKNKVGQFWEASCFEQLGVVYKKSGLTERAVQFFQYAQEVLRQEPVASAVAREHNAQRRLALERMVEIVQQPQSVQTQSVRKNPENTQSAMPTMQSLPLTTTNTLDSAMIARYVRKEVEALLPANATTTRRALPTLSENTTQPANQSLNASQQQNALMNANRSANPPLARAPMLFNVGGLLGSVFPMLPAGAGSAGSSGIQFEVFGEYKFLQELSAIARIGGLLINGYTANAQTLDNGTVLMPSLANTSAGYVVGGARYTLIDIGIQPYVDLGVGALIGGGSASIGVPISVGIIPTISERIQAIVEFQAMNTISSAGHSLYAGFRGGIRYRFAW